MLENIDGTTGIAAVAIFVLLLLVQIIMLLKVLVGIFKPTAKKEYSTRKDRWVKVHLCPGCTRALTYVDTIIGTNENGEVKMTYVYQCRHTSIACRHAGKYFNVANWQSDIQLGGDPFGVYV